jgi:hypothetical protein
MNIQLQLDNISKNIQLQLDNTIRILQLQLDKMTMNRSLDLDMITNQGLPSTTRHSPELLVTTRHSSHYCHPKS